MLVESASASARSSRAAARRWAWRTPRSCATRAEEWRPASARCDVVCARALAALPVLCEYAAPLLRDGGVAGRLEGRGRRGEEAADGAAAATQLGLARAGAAPVTPFRGSERRTLHVSAQDRAHAGRLPAAARHCNETPALRDETALKVRAKRAQFGRRDPPPAPLASGAAWASCTPSPTRRAGSGRPRPRSTSPPASRRPGYDDAARRRRPAGQRHRRARRRRHEGAGLYDVLSGDVAAADAVRATGVERLSLLASTPDLAGRDDGAAAAARIGAAAARRARARARRATRTSCSTARRRSARSRSTRWSPPTA